MKIYIAIWEDRHLDATVYPFYDPKKAIDWAKAKARKLACNGGCYQERDYGRNDGWIFYAEYSTEDDCVRVVEAEVIEDEDI